MSLRVLVSQAEAVRVVPAHLSHAFQTPAGVFRPEETHAAGRWQHRFNRNFDIA